MLELILVAESFFESRLENRWTWFRLFVYPIDTLATFHDCNLTQALPGLWKFQLVFL